jgi:hypothetical protein
MLLLLDVGADLKAENDVACLGFAYTELCLRQLTQKVVAC